MMLIYSFADDAKLYKHIKGCNGELELQREIDKLVEWANKMDSQNHL